MATKPVNSESPGQASLYLDDLILAVSGFSDFQSMSLIRTIKYEWESGHPPADSKVWQRINRPTNGRQKAELEELIEIYETLPYVQKMRRARNAKIEERQNRSLAAQEREAEKTDTQEGSDEKTQQPSIKKPQQRSCTSLEDNSSNTNTDAPPQSGNGRPFFHSSILPLTNSSPDPPSGDTGGKPTAPQKPRRRKAAQPRDARLDHWAIREIRKLSHYWPDREIWDEIIAALGDVPDVERLTLCYRAWVKKGWNKTNSAWYLDWFVHGIPGQANGRASPGKLTVAEQNQAAMEEAVRRMDERLRDAS